MVYISAIYQWFVFLADLFHLEFGWLHHSIIRILALLHSVRYRSPGLGPLSKFILLCSCHILDIQKVKQIHFK